MRTIRPQALLLLTLLALGAGCSPGDEEIPPPAAERFTDDLAGILDRGYLRVLVEGDDDRHLPRHDDPSVRSRELARAFADRHSIEVRFVARDTFSTLLPALTNGIGDLVAANLTITVDRQARFAFSAALDHAVEEIVSRRGGVAPANPAETGGSIGVPAGTSFEATAWRLASIHQRLSVTVWEGRVSAEDALDSVAQGRVDYTIQDSNRLEVLLAYREDLQAGPELGPKRPLAWAARASNPQLIEAVDDFLHEERLLGNDEESYVADLPELKERRRIRMITRNNAANYFLWRGRVMGFEYELARKFAEETGLRLQVVAAPSHDDLLPMLRAGEGDFVAAFLTRTPQREEDGVRFSRPYHFASEIIVGRADEEPMEDVSALAGRRIAVRRSSSYWTHLSELRANGGPDFELVEVPATMETEDIIGAVGDGIYDLTLADSHLLELEMTARDDLCGLLVIGEPISHGWAVHPDNEELAAEFDAFFARHYRGLFYNVTYQKYFERPVHLGSGWESSDNQNRLSPYDDLVRELALGHDYDWRLIVAQIYQESRFDPTARSWAGAVGLMQLLPRTARELGYSDLEDPRTSIEAGLRYLDWVWLRFEDSLNDAEHMWFTLAAYNAGHGHVRDARRLAGKLGLDPDRWSGNVELAMLRLSQSKYAREARHGYVRGHEPVEYVRAIRERYQAYVDLIGER